ncbi:MAG: hypothetical protein RBS08_07835 [Bdellovibrionales bacterium]|jgi:hypothetical protein|nr:hypothetical protein [Bdellovibrionales bacterium]
MSQASPTIGANKSGLVYRQEDNDGKKALLTHHKGASAPGYAEAGTIWLDDSATPWRLKFFDGSDWIMIGALHAGQNAFLPYVGSGALRMCPFAADTGTVNACAVAPVPAPPQHQNGQMVILSPAHDVTGNTTLALGDLDLRSVLREDGSALLSGDMRAGRTYVLIYNGENFILTNPTRDNTIPAGSVVGHAQTTYTGYAALTTAVPFDNTVPQPGEGTEILRTSLTPKSATNRVRVRFSGFAATSGIFPITAFLCINGSAAVQAIGAYAPVAGQPVSLNFEYEHIPGDTNTQVYTVRVGPGGIGSVRMNGSNTGRLFGGCAAATLTVEEIKE